MRPSRQAEATPNSTLSIWMRHKRPWQNIDIWWPGDETGLCGQNIAVKSATVEVDTSGKGSGLWLFDKLLLQTEDINCYIYYPFLSFGDFPLVLAKTSLGAPKMRENYAWKNPNRRIFLKAPLGEKAYLSASWNRPATAGNIRNPLQNISFIGPPTYSIYTCLFSLTFTHITKENTKEFSPSPILTSKITSELECTQLCLQF